MVQPLYCLSPGYSVGCRREFLPKSLSPESQRFHGREDVLCLPWRSLLCTLLSQNSLNSTGYQLTGFSSLQTGVERGCWVLPGLLDETKACLKQWLWFFFFFTFCCLVFLRASVRMLWFLPVLLACPRPGTGTRRGRGDIPWILGHYGQNCLWRPEDKGLTGSQNTGVRQGGSRENAKTKTGT